MAGPLNFDAFLGWVNVTDPNNIPPDARVLSADDLLRYEKLGIDTVAAVNGLAAEVELFDADATVAASIADPASETHTTVQGMVDTGVADFQAVIDGVPAQVTTQVNSEVPPKVSEALAADSTVANAAANAVGTELNKAGVFKGAVASPDPAVALSFTDKTGRRFWVEAGYDGRPTPHTISILSAALQSSIDAAATASVNATTGIAKIADYYGWAWVVTDSASRVLGGFRPDGSFEAKKMTFPDGSVPLKALATDLQASVSTGGATVSSVPVDGGVVHTRKKGTSWELRRDDTATGTSTLLHSAGVIKDLLLSGTNVFFTAADADGSNTRTLYVPAAGGTVARVIPYVGFIAHGDSMTHGMGGGYGEFAWPAVAAKQLGIPYYNSGLSAQTSTEIATDQGGITPTFTVEGNQIPASGAVTLSNVSPTGTWRAGWEWTWQGYLEGVYGTLKKSTTEVWTFTRSVAGTAQTVPSPAKFESEQGRLYGDWIQTFWIGRNNVDKAIVTRDMDAMVARLTPLQKRFLVFPIFNTAGEPSGSTGYTNVMAINTQLAATYGDRYVDTRRWIIDNGLAAAGITPTAADTTAIAEDRIPPSLQPSGDGTHLNATGYDVLGKYIATVITSKGWV